MALTCYEEEDPENMVEDYVQPKLGPAKVRLVLPSNLSVRQVGLGYQGPVRATLPPSTLFADRALLCRGYSISDSNTLVETVSKYKGLH